MLHDAHLTNCVVNLAYLQYLAKRPLEIQKCSLYFIVHDKNAQNMNAQNPVQHQFLAVQRSLFLALGMLHTHTTLPAHAHHVG